MFLRPASELTAAPVEWLWPGYLALGSLAILDGDPGLGKSLLTLDLAARLSTGRAWPDGSASNGPAPTALLCDEDPEDLVIARLKSLGAHTPRTLLWPRLIEPGLPRFPAETDRLDRELTESHAKLVIIDPIVAFLDRSINMNSDASVRRALTPLARLAEKHRAAFLMVRHLNKANGPHALYRGNGSIAFVASCRLALLVGHDPHMEEHLVLAQQKNNIIGPQTSLTYDLPKDGPRIHWHGACPWLADDLTNHRPCPARRRARDFLRLFLERSARPSREIRAAADKAGVTEITLKRAYKDLRVANQRVYDGGIRTDYWLLPGQRVPDDPTAEATDLDEWLRRWREMYPPRSPSE